MCFLATFQISNFPFHSKIDQLVRFVVDEVGRVVVSFGDENFCSFLHRSHRKKQEESVEDHVDDVVSK